MLVLEYYVFKRNTHMPVEVTKKLFTVDEYYRMAETGILGPEDRVELIDGEIIQMSPIGNSHLARVNRANDVFTAAFRGRAVVSVQNPLRLNNYTEPEPDIVLLKPRQDFYEAKRPDAESALLVIEVSDTSLEFDREVKLARYAVSGVPEVWIENLEDGELLVYRDPVGKQYITALTLHAGDSVSVLAFPETQFKIEDVLG